jgi:hypothetical protein
MPCDVVESHVRLREHHYGCHGNRCALHMQPWLHSHGHRPHHVPDQFRMEHSCPHLHRYSFLLSLILAANPCSTTLISPTNGVVSPTSGSTGTVATYTCNTGYTRSGAATSTCQATATWSAIAATCVGESFGFAPYISQRLCGHPHQPDQWWRHPHDGCHRHRCYVRVQCGLHPLRNCFNHVSDFGHLEFCRPFVYRYNFFRKITN